MPPDTDFHILANEICTSQKLTLIQEEGEGSFKKTFQVIDKNNNNLALKIFTSPNIDSRSQREINTMLRCNHPGIAKLLSINTHKINDIQYLYVIEEYFSGGTLSKLQNNKLTTEEVIELGKHLINSISYLASQDLVHRDIKPDNILFRKDSLYPILTDFGIVRDLQATSETKTWLLSGPCTPYYAAPEQLNNDKLLIDWRTDQFSLGITLSIMLFRKHPFQHEGFSPSRTIHEVANRGSHSDFFQHQIATHNLQALHTMTQVWPANRFRNPEILLNNWL